MRTNSDANPMAMLEEPLIDVDYMSKPMCTMDEFFDELCKKVGRLYGLEDIRDAK